MHSDTLNKVRSRVLHSNVLTAAKMIKESDTNARMDDNRSFSCINGGMLKKYHLCENISNNF